MTWIKTQMMNIPPHKTILLKVASLKESIGAIIFYPNNPQMLPLLIALIVALEAATYKIHPVISSTYAKRYNMVDCELSWVSASAISFAELTTPSAFSLLGNQDPLSVGFFSWSSGCSY